MGRFDFLVLYVAERRTLPDLIESSSKLRWCVSYAANGRGGYNRQVLRYTSYPLCQNIPPILHCVKLFFLF